MRLQSSLREQSPERCIASTALPALAWPAAQPSPDIPLHYSTSPEATPPQPQLTNRVFFSAPTPVPPCAAVPSFHSMTSPISELLAAAGMHIRSTPWAPLHTEACITVRRQNTPHPPPIAGDSSAPQMAWMRPCLSGRPSLVEPSPIQRPCLVGPSPIQRPSLAGPSPSEKMSLHGPCPIQRPSLVGPSPSVGPSLHGPCPNQRPSLAGPSPSERVALVGPCPIQRHSLVGPSPSKRISLAGPCSSVRPSLAGPSPIQWNSLDAVCPSERPSLDGPYPRERISLVGPSPSQWNYLDGAFPGVRPPLPSLVGASLGQWNPLDGPCPRERHSVDERPHSLTPQHLEERHAAGGSHGGSSPRASSQPTAHSPPGPQSSLLLQCRSSLTEDGTRLEASAMGVWKRALGDWEALQAALKRPRPTEWPSLDGQHPSKRSWTGGGEVSCSPCLDLNFNAARKEPPRRGHWRLPDLNLPCTACDGPPSPSHQLPPTPAPETPHYKAESSPVVTVALPSGSAVQPTDLRKATGESAVMGMGLQRGSLTSSSEDASVPGIATAVSLFQSYFELKFQVARKGVERGQSLAENGAAPSRDRANHITGTPVQVDREAQLWVTRKLERLPDSSHCIVRRDN